MAGGFRIQMDSRGLSRLARTLKAAGADMQDLKASHKQASEVAKPAIQKEAPVLSGTLRHSIRSGATQRAGVVRAGSSKVRYAGPINYGWPKHHIEPAGFMGRGLDESQDEINDIFAKAIDKALAQVQGD